MSEVLGKKRYNIDQPPDLTTAKFGSGVAIINPATKFAPPTEIETFVMPATNPIANSLSETVGLVIV